MDLFFPVQHALFSTLLYCLLLTSIHDMMFQCLLFNEIDCLQTVCVELNTI